MAELLHVIAVVALLGVAAAIATPKGRLPLALRGIQRALGRPAEESSRAPVSAARRILAFVLVLLAAAVSLARF